MLCSWTGICECTPGVTGLPLEPCSVHRWEHRLHWRTSGPHATFMESDSQKCAWAPCRRSFCRVWAMLLLSFLHKRSNTAPCNVPSPCMSSTILKGGDCGGWQRKPCDGTCISVILEELDYLCSLNALQLPSHAASSNKQKSVMRCTSNEFTVVSASWLDRYISLKFNSVCVRLLWSSVPFILLSSGYWFVLLLPPQSPSAVPPSDVKTAAVPDRPGKSGPDSAYRPNSARQRQRSHNPAPEARLWSPACWRGFWSVHLFHRDQIRQN